MDIKKALAELKKAQEDIQRLQKERDEALKQVTKAKVEEARYKPTESKQSPAYHSKSYWDERYENEEKSAKNSIYEWYVSFDQIKTLLKRHTISTSKIYLPGCGNSVLGEDLTTLDVQQIVASDFSSVIIKSMQERATTKQLKNLFYKEGDLFNLKDEKASTYDLIVDKGTLDAIASDKANAQTNRLKNEMDNIGKYINEMWRILKLHGHFIIITSMPMDIFESFILPYLQTWSTETKQMITVSNWKENSPQNLIYQEILLSEAGNKVYFYTIEKISHMKNEKDVLMESISSLLDDATRAKLRQDMLDEEEGGFTHTVSTAGAAAASTTTTANPVSDTSHLKYIEKVYEWNEIVDKEKYAHDHIHWQIDYVNSQLRPNGYLLVSYDIEGEYDENDMIRLVCTTMTASASTSTTSSHDDSLWYEPSEQQCESFEYITIIPAPATTPSTVNDATKKKISHGESKLALPCYAGNFALSYIRDYQTTIVPTTSTNKTAVPGEQPSYRKEYVKLSQSEMISIRFPFYAYHPDEKGLVPAADRTSNNTSNIQQQRQRRRKACPILPQDAYSILIEDMQNVQRLSITIGLLDKQTSTQRYAFARCLGWIYPVSATSAATATATGTETSKKSEDIGILLEVDLLTTISETNNGYKNGNEQKRVQTVYIPIQLQDSFLQWSMINVSQAYGEIQKTSHAEEEQIFLRIPYTLPKASLLPYASLWNTVACWESLRQTQQNQQPPQAKAKQAALQTQATKKQKPLRAYYLYCSNCEQEIGSFQSIQRLHPLPTGFFDENMHDFICCENIGADGGANGGTSCGMNLTTDQMNIPIDALYYGPLYTILDVKHLYSKVCSFVCKETFTICDLLTTMGAAVAVSTIPGYTALSNAYSGEKEKKLQLLTNAFLNPVIGIDSAAIRCKRCCAYLGDATLRADTGNDVEDINNSSSNDLEEELTFRHEEVASIKLLWNKISIRKKENIHDIITPAATLSMASIHDETRLEQIVTRLIVHIYEKFNLPIMCLYNAEALEIYGQTAKRNRENIQRLNVIMIKVMNKNYRQSREATMINDKYFSLSFHGVVKVMIQFGKAIDILKGNEARIPLQHEEFMQLHEFLNRKKTESIDGIVTLPL